MIRITIPGNLVEQLNPSKPVVLCDEGGNPLGTFTPVSKLTEQQRIAMTLPEHLLDSPTPLEELNRRLREERPIPHEEVMKEIMEMIGRSA